MATLFQKLGYSYSDPHGDVTDYSADTLEHLKALPSLIDPWQTQDISDSSVGDYFQNPLSTVSTTISVTANSIYAVLNSNVSYSVTGVSAVMANVMSSTLTLYTAAVNFKDHTDRISGVSSYNDYVESGSAAAATKPFGFSPFVPGVGVGGHCIPVDPNYLSYAAEQLGINANFIKLAEKTNIEMPMYLAKRFQKDLGGSLVDKNIQIVGLSYKTEIADLRESPAIALINELRRLGAVVTWHDPIVKKWNGEQSCELNLKVDLGVIVTPHGSIDFEPWQLGNIRVVDVSATSQEYGWTKYL